MKRLTSLVLIVVFMLSFSAVCYAEQLPENSYLKVYSLDVGEGSATVVDCDGYIMMFDGGTPEYSDMIYSFLKEHDYKRIDYLIGSHPDADHIGGLSGALNFAEAGIIFCTVDHDDSKSFQSFLKYAEEQNNRIIIPDAGNAFSLGSAKAEILAPKRGMLISDNTSLVLRLTYGSTSFLFMGDSEMADEETLVQLGCLQESTVLFVGHHGSATSTGNGLLDAVKPKYAVISVGPNKYGHPSEEVLNNLNQRGVAIYRTDENGTITIECNDKEEIKFSVEKEAEKKTPPLLLLLPEETPAAENQITVTKSTEQKQMDKVLISYVANKSTKKFHYPSCGSVTKMKEANKWYYEGTREELISLGYDPCGNCHP